MRIKLFSIGSLVFLSFLTPVIASAGHIDDNRCVWMAQAMLTGMALMVFATLGDRK